MAVQVMSLASGALSTTGAQSTLYTSPTGPPALTTIIKGIRLVNKDAASRAVNLYINRGSADGNTNRYISPKNVMIPAGGLLIDDQEITMTSGDVINADVNGVSGVNVDFYISGIQR